MERPVKFLASLSADSVTDMELIKSRISDFKGLSRFKSGCSGIGASW